MKKYNMREIMMAAWRIKRNAYLLPFSECLKRSWFRAKGLAEQCANDTVPTKEFINGMTVTVDGYTRTLSRWTKGGNDRVYINGGSTRGDGFVDLKNRTTCLRGNLTYQTKIAKMILEMEF